MTGPLQSSPASLKQAAEKLAPPAAETITPPEILFLVGADWYFCSHRLPIARGARDAGYRVLVATHVDRHGERITEEGFDLIPLRIRRGLRGPWEELRSLGEVIRLFRKRRPALVHNVSVKPILYGSIAARLARLPGVVHAFPGLGYSFSSRHWLARVLRPCLKLGFRFLWKAQSLRVIVQNREDRELLIENRWVDPNKIVLIRGSGVDTQRFLPGPPPSGPITITMVARMLWEKGIGELIEAARSLRERGDAFRLVVAGAPDPENPRTVPAARLEAWRDAGLIDWVGHREDIAAVWGQSHIAVLPTYYGEGVPKALLEAAACALPIVATDVAGCREVVRHGENGLLVQPRDPESLATALHRLISDAALRKSMGAKGREIVLAEFSEEKIVEETLAVYSNLMEEAQHESSTVSTARQG